MLSLAGRGHVANSLGRGPPRQLPQLPLHLTDFGLSLMLCFLLPFPDAFLAAYITLAAITFPVYLAYLALSALALRKLH
jgi:hypothetical protein